MLNAEQDFSASVTNGVVNLQNISFGVSNINVGNSGFAITTVQAGTSELVKTIELPYENGVR